jgi:dienelactone hydrolase
VLGRIALIVAGAFATLAASCGSDGESRSPAEILSEATESGDFGVGMTTLDLVDTSRPTAANGDYPGADDRRLRTDVWYPAAPSGEQETRDAAVAEGGPYPLVVLSHGLSALSSLYSSYGQHLASQGYVVAAPNYPLSNAGAPGGPRLIAVLEQPDDVSFVIDEMLAFNADEGSAFFGVIDPERIGATGHSLGAMTTFMSVNGDDSDPRIKAALPFSTPGCFFGEDFVADESVPTLFVSGTHDLITPPVSADHPYDIANAPRYLVTVRGADHTRFADVDIPDTSVISGSGLADGISEFIPDALAAGEALGGGTAACGLGAEPPDGVSLLEGSRQREILRTLQVIFFDGYLKDDDWSVDFLADDAEASFPEITLAVDLGN